MFKCINYVVKLQIDIGEMILNTRKGRFLGAFNIFGP